jgi:hypothetical protein
MSLIDEALEPFWPPESSTVPYRAFREFLERNFLASTTRRTEAYTDSPGYYRLKSFSAHTHVLSDTISISPGMTVEVTITPEADLPDGEWAAASFDVRGDHLDHIQPWTRGEGQLTFSFDGRHAAPVIIVAGFSLGFSYVSSRSPNLMSEHAHYQIRIES